MIKLLYYIVILPLSHLPFSLLYKISDALYLVLYKLFSYRVSVVDENINRVFPDKLLAFKKKLKEDFYRHFCDLIVEGVKAFTISNKEIKKRFKLIAVEKTLKDFQDRKDIIIAAAHYGNWEWASLVCPLIFYHKCSVIVTPLSNSFINEKISSSRSRNGYNIIHKDDVKDKFGKNMGQPQAYFFLIDQSPSNPERALWTKFLGVDTAVQYGVEKYSKLGNSPIYYISVHKRKRGHYEVVIKRLLDNPSELPKGEIIETLNKEIEKDIYSQPEFWLWSHRKWKHKKK